MNICNCDEFGVCKLTLALDLKIEYLGVRKYQEVNSDYENTFGQLLRVYKSVLLKCELWPSTDFMILKPQSLNSRAEVDMFSKIDP